MAATGFDVRPGAGIGPIEIGMTRQEALAAALADGLQARDFRRGRSWKDGPPDLLIGDQLFAYFEDGDRVVEVEVAANFGRPVSCLNLKLAAPYAEIRFAMQAIARLDETNPEFPSSCAYPEIGLDLWSEAEDGDPVQAILVRAPDPHAFDGLD
jgi:hypothetical protein